MPIGAEGAAAARRGSARKRGFLRCGTALRRAGLRSRVSTGGTGVAVGNSGRGRGTASQLWVGVAVAGTTRLVGERGRPGYGVSAAASVFMSRERCAVGVVSAFRRHLSGRHGGGGLLFRATVAGSAAGATAGDSSAGGLSEDDEELLEILRSGQFGPRREGSDASDARERVRIHSSSGVPIKGKGLAGEDDGVTDGLWYAAIVEQDESIERAVGLEIELGERFRCCFGIDRLVFAGLEYDLQLICRQVRFGSRVDVPRVADVEHG